MALPSVRCCSCVVVDDDVVVRCSCFLLLVSAIFYHHYLLLTTDKNTLSKIVFMNHRSDDKRDRDTSSPWKIVEGDSRQKESFEFQPMDWSTFHSGCTLKAGNKYIANQWLTRSVVESLCEMRVYVKEEKEKEESMGEL